MNILITGITGQDGSYLADLLVAEGHHVSGLVRRSSGPMARGGTRIDHLIRQNKITLYRGDLADAGSVRRVIDAVEPDEIYHLGAQSHVGVSFETPGATIDVTGIGTQRVLEAAFAYRRARPAGGVHRDVRVYNACSSEIFGNTPGPLHETSTIAPVSPYGAAKAMSLMLCRQYRDRGLHVSSGILFNHCSPRQATEFLPAKVAWGALERHRTRDWARPSPRVRLGTMTARRDWGWAPDYVALMPKILRHEQPIELVVGSGTSIAVQDYVEAVFSLLSLDTGEHVTFVDTDRPLEIWDLVADPACLRNLFGPVPTLTATSLAAKMIAGLRESANVG